MLIWLGLGLGGSLNIYGNQTVDLSTVRLWVVSFSNGSVMAAVK